MSGMSIARRVVVAVAVALVVVLVAGVVTTVTFVRRPLPDVGGTSRVDGIDADVEIIRDDLGIPNIYAESATDLFYAQGYVHAQDRFFEMDYRRHVTAGRLSELVGANESALDADRAIRTMGWRHVAEQEWERLQPETRAYLEAYSDGVNAYIADRQPSGLALEYTVLGLQVDVDDIEPWQPVDTLAWLKAMAWDLVGNYGDELARAAVYGRVNDLAMVEALYPPYPTTRNLPILPTDAEVEEQRAEQERREAEADASATDLTGGSDAEDSAPATHATSAAGIGGDAVDAAAAALGAVPRLLGEGDGIGSNSWVVAGEHTESGSPLLANDPHLGVSAPGVWYQVGLHCRTVGEECPFDVSGFSFAGMPGVIIGHNADLAWGLTNMATDTSDFFLERVFPDGTYLYDGQRLPLTERTEVIEVNGGEDVEIVIRSTPHGPIVSDAIGGTRSAAAAPVPDGSPPAGLSGYAVALSWTALSPGRTADAIFMMNRAADATDVAAAAAALEVPAQNIVFATADGDIGYQAPGRIPVRADVPGAVVPSDGTWPRLGWDPAYDWQGYVPADQMPAALNPPEGFVVAANQPVLSPGSAPALGTDADFGYRSQEIRDRIVAHIAEGTPFTVADMTRIQMVETDPVAEMLVPVLLDQHVSDPFVRDAVELLEDWDHDAHTESAAAAYFAAVWANLLRLTFWDQLPPDQHPRGGSRYLEVVRGLLEEVDSPWWDDRATLTVVEQRDEILQLALADARAQLTVSLGKDPADWQWGRLHRVAPQHAVLGGEGVPAIVADFVNLGPEPVGGGSSIVNANGWNAAAWDADGYPDFTVTAVPSMRMVVDLADLDASTWVQLAGNSGHPASNHYHDQLSAWAAGEPFGWAFSRPAVEEAGTDTLTLRAP